ncbi:MAG: hypothetical protein Q4E65_01150 [Clostridia bacterium]|nr:hypothetical protein [Clostridia bacterium]
MPLFFLLPLIAVAGLFWNIRVFVSLRLCGSAVYVRTEYRVFYGLLPLRFEFYGEWKDPYTWKKLEKDRWHIPRFSLKKKKKTRKGKWKGMLSLRRHVRLVKLRCEGEIGCADSVVGTLLLTGFIRIALDTLACVQRIPCEIAVFPTFEGNACRLKLEGIFVLRAAHIMLAVLREKMKRKQGEEYAASH